MARIRDRLITVTLCAGLGLLFGFMGWLAACGLYLVGVLMAGSTHPSDLMPLWAIRVCLPCGLLIGATIGAVAD